MKSKFEFGVGYSDGSYSQSDSMSSLKYVYLFYINSQSRDNSYKK